MKRAAGIPVHHTAGFPKELMPSRRPPSSVVVTMWEWNQMGRLRTGHSYQTEEKSCVDSKVL